MNSQQNTPKPSPTKTNTKKTTHEHEEALIKGMELLLQNPNPESVLLSNLEKSLEHWARQLSSEPKEEYVQEIARVSQQIEQLVASQQGKVSQFEKASKNLGSFARTTLTTPKGIAQGVEQRVNAKVRGLIVNRQQRQSHQQQLKNQGLWATHASNDARVRFIGANGVATEVLQGELQTIGKQQPDRSLIAENPMGVLTVSESMQTVLNGAQEAAQTAQEQQLQLDNSKNQNKRAA